MRSSFNKLLTASIAYTLFACGNSAPANPTYFDHVAPILRANCGRCHAADPQVEKIGYFRLDRHVSGDTSVLLDVADPDIQGLIIERAVDMQEVAMPLDYVLSERQRETLQRWFDNGAPRGTRDNQLPQITAVAPADVSVTVDQSLDLTYHAWDDDGDGLLVAIGYREQGTTGGNILYSGLGGGTRSVQLDTGLLASQQVFEFFAIVDDGYSENPTQNAHEVTLLSHVTVDHGARGTAPTVLLLTPNGGSTLFGTVTVSWSATDPDAGDVLTIGLELVTVDQAGNELSTQPIATGLANDPQSFQWDTSGVAASDGSGNPIWYKLRVTASDAGANNTRSDDSDVAFTIAPEVTDTSLTWADVKPIFATYCGSCHFQPAKTPVLDYFRVDKYDMSDPVPPVNSDIGVFEQRALIYQRLVVEKSMPPMAEPQPSQADIDKVGEWISAGAPKDSGPSDGPPVFMWNAPNNSAITNASNGTVTLSWSATDPEMLPFMMATISFSEINAMTDQLAVCDAGITNWTPVPGLTDVPAGSFSWTLPNEGYFCLRGELTDAAGQTVNVIATRPVKFKTMGP